MLSPTPDPANRNGPYYVLVDFSDLSDEESMTFAKRLTAEASVAPPNA
jgi:hypothetical protein